MRRPQGCVLDPGDEVGVYWAPHRVRGDGVGCCKRWPHDVQEVASRYTRGGLTIYKRWPHDIQEVASRCARGSLTMCKRWPHDAQEVASRCSLTRHPGLDPGPMFRRRGVYWAPVTGLCVYWAPHRVRGDGVLRSEGWVPYFCHVLRPPFPAWPTTVPPTSSRA